MYSYNISVNGIYSRLGHAVAENAVFNHIGQVAQLGGGAEILISEHGDGQQLGGRFPAGSRQSDRGICVYPRRE